MKKNTLIPAILSLVALLFGTFAYVQSDETKETRENKTIEKKVEVKVLGDVAADSVTIDGDKIKVRLPDGSIQTIDLGNIKNGQKRIVTPALSEKAVKTVLFAYQGIPKL